MNTTSLRSTTAILVALSLVQPLPAMAQSGVQDDRVTVGSGHRKQDTDTRTNEEICAEAGIADALACELHILQVLAATGAETPAAADPEPAVTLDDATPEVPVAEAPIEPVAEAPVEAAPVEPAEPVAAAPVAVEPAAPAEPTVETPVTEPPTAESPVAESPVAAAPAEPAEPVAEAPASPEPATPSEPVAQAPIVVPATPVALGQDCLGSAGAVGCADALSAGTLDAIAAGTDAEAGATAEVTTEIITETSSRSSDEEFRTWSHDSPRGAVPIEGAAVAPAPGSSPITPATDRGMSDLERAGLFALGALVVGAILTNGQRVDANTGDRVVVVDSNGDYLLLKDDDALLRQPGSELRTERYADGTTRTVVIRDDGSRIVTIRDSSGRALRRVHVDRDGHEYLLFDDTRAVEPVDVRSLPAPTYDYFDYRASTDRESLRLALLAADQGAVDRGFSLNQIRVYKEVRDLAPEINLESITFATNSSAIRASQAEQLRQIGLLMRDMILDNPTELFLIEGHTDAIGDAGYNLLLSDRRAESAALALSEYFFVPAENMVVQGYGESYPRIPTQAAEELNRRVAVRRITGLVSRP